MACFVSFLFFHDIAPQKMNEYVPLSMMALSPIVREKNTSLPLTILYAGLSTQLGK